MRKIQQKPKIQKWVIDSSKKKNETCPIVHKKQRIMFLTLRKMNIISNKTQKSILKNSVKDKTLPRS